MPVVYSFSLDVKYDKDIINNYLTPFLMAMIKFDQRIKVGDHFFVKKKENTEEGSVVLSGHILYFKVIEIDPHGVGVIRPNTLIDTEGEPLQSDPTPNPNQSIEGDDNLEYKLHTSVGITPEGVGWKLFQKINLEQRKRGDKVYNVDTEDGAIYCMDEDDPRHGQIIGKWTPFQVWGGTSVNGYYLKEA